ncbi:MAG: hypothetical protein GKR77_06365 [Legionellales bacterium]|nr:hypothetical protein [Legionellales bacterium]
MDYFKLEPEDKRRERFSQMLAHLDAAMKHEDKLDSHERTRVLDERDRVLKELFPNVISNEEINGSLSIATVETLRNLWQKDMAVSEFTKWNISLLIHHVEQAADTLEVNSHKLFSIGMHRKSVRIREALNRCHNHYQHGVDEQHALSGILDFSHNGEQSIRETLNQERLRLIDVRHMFFHRRTTSLRHVEDILTQSQFLQSDDAFEPCHVSQLV